MALDISSRKVQSKLADLVAPTGAIVDLDARNASTVLEYPPVDWSTTTGSMTVTTGSYGRGAYTVTASTQNTGASYAFESTTLFNSTDSFWGSATTFNSTTGSYTGTVTTLAQDGTSYSGEWIQLQMPSSIKLTQFTILPRQDSLWTKVSPRNFVLLGSNDNTSWNVMFTGTAVTNWTAAAKTFTVNTSSSFLYYRLVVSRVGNNDIDTAFQQSSVQIARLRLFGTPSTVASAVPLSSLGTFSSPNVVQNGLIAWFDPANAGSYSGTGASLYNLVDGTSLGTLGGTYSTTTGGIRLSNTSVNSTANVSYLQCASLTNITTVSMWYYQHSTSGSTRTLIDGRTGATGGTIMSTGIGSSFTTGTLYVNGGSSSTMSWTNIESIGVWRNITVIANSSLTDDLTFFAATTLNNGLDVTFGPILVYNRVITQAENESNFNAIRSRYSLDGGNPRVTIERPLAYSTSGFNNGSYIAISSSSNNALVSTTGTVAIGTNRGLTISALARPKSSAAMTTATDGVYPPAAMTANTTTLSAQSYGNGLYTVTSSSANGTNNIWNAFDKNVTTYFGAVGGRYDANGNYLGNNEVFPPGPMTADSTTFSGLLTANGTYSISVSSSLLYKYPPIGLSSTTETVTGQVYGNGTYTIVRPGNQGTVVELFDGITQRGTASSNQFANYDSVTGLYTGTRSTLDETSSTSTLGEYIQLNLPTAIVLDSFKLYKNFETGRPVQWSLFGSTDNSTWYKLYERTSDANNVDVWDEKVNVINAYTQYRIIFTKKMANSGNTFINIVECELIEKAGFPYLAMDRSTSGSSFWSSATGVYDTAGSYIGSASRISVSGEWIFLGSTNNLCTCPKSVTITCLDPSRAPSLFNVFHNNGSWVSVTASNWDTNPTQTFSFAPLNTANGRHSWGIVVRNLAGTGGSLRIDELFFTQMDPYTTSDSMSTVHKGEWLQLQMPNSIYLRSFTLTAGANDNPSSFALLGSTNNSTWDLVYNTPFSVTLSTSGSTFLANSSSLYNYFRIVCKNTSSTAGSVRVVELSFTQAGAPRPPLTIFDGRDITGSQRVHLGQGATFIHPLDYVEIIGENPISITESTTTEYVGNNFTYNNIVAPPSQTLSKTVLLLRTTTDYYYQFVVPVTTTYNIILQSLMPNGNNDSLFTSLNGKSFDTYTGTQSRHFAFRTIYSSVTLTAGTHTLTLRRRETVAIGSIIIQSTDSKYYGYSVNNTNLYGSIHNGDSVYPRISSVGLNKITLDKFQRYTLTYNDITGSVKTYVNNNLVGTDTAIAVYPPQAMTANTTAVSGSIYGNGSYIASSSTSTMGSLAFDKNLSTSWSSSIIYNTNGSYAGSVSTTAGSTVYSGEWLQLQLPVSIRLTKYSLNSSTTTPSSFALVGSSDGNTWATIDSQTNVTNWTSTNTYTVNTSSYYSYLRLIITNTVSTATSVSITELYLFGIEQITNKTLTTLSIGRSMFNGGTTSSLDIADLKVYDRELTQSDLQTISNVASKPKVISSSAIANITNNQTGIISLDPKTLDLQDGAPVAEWNGFSQSLSTRCPLYRASGGYNNGPYLEFRKGSKQFLSASNTTNFGINSNGGFTIAGIARFPGDPTLNERIVELTGSTGTSSSYGTAVGNLAVTRSGTDTNLKLTSLNIPTTSEAVAAVTTWTTRATVSNNWFSICWSPELSIFVAVGTSGTGNRVMTSSDGVTWTTRSSAADNGWMSVTWSSKLSLFVAVSNSGTGNRVMTSNDGITWTTRSSAIDNSWTSVTWSPQLSLFVTVGTSGTGNRIMTSSNGINWVSRNSPADNNWQQVIWVSELALFVAVSHSGTGNRVMTSPDGVTWTTRASAADNGWYSITWSPELSLLVAVSYFGTNRVMTSNDGVVWTTRIPSVDNDWLNVTWSSELRLFVAVAISGTGNRVMTSNNGLVWTTRASAADNSWRYISWSPELGIFAVVGQSGTGNRVMTSNPTKLGIEIPTERNAIYKGEWVPFAARYNASDATLQVYKGTSINTTSSVLEYPPAAMTANTTAITSTNYGNGLYTANVSSQVSGSTTYFNMFDKNQDTEFRGGAGRFDTTTGNFIITYPRTMTADTTIFTGVDYANGTYIVSASSVDTGSAAYLAFDNNINTSWTSAALYDSITGAYIGSNSMTAGSIGYSGEWIQIQAPQTHVTTEIIITPDQIDFATRSPSSFKLFYSSDGITWTLTQSRTASTWTSAAQTFVGNSYNARNYWRILVESVGNTGENTNRDRVKIASIVFSLPEFTTDTLTSTVYYGNWVQLSLPTPIKLSRYNLVSTVRQPVDVYLFGSNDNSNWELMKSNSLTWSSTSNAISVNSQKEFTRYRLLVTKVLKDFTGRMDIHSLEFFSRLTDRTFTQAILGKSTGEIYSNLDLGGLWMYDRPLSDRELVKLYSSITANSSPDSQLTKIESSISDTLDLGSAVLAIDAKSEILRSDVMAPILEYPPDNRITANVTNVTGADYGNGVYLCSASSVYSPESSRIASNAFESTTLVGGLDAYWTSDLTYNTTTGSYTGTVATIAQNGTSYSGEWLQINLPQAIKLSSYSILPRQDTIWDRRSPSTFVILGSNDGVAWNLVDSESNINWSSSAKTFTSTSSVAYRIYRMVVLIVGNTNILGTTSARKNSIQISRWRLFGTPSFSDNSVLSLVYPPAPLTANSTVIATTSTSYAAGTYTASASTTTTGSAFTPFGSADTLVLGRKAYWESALSFNATTGGFATAATTWVTRASAADNEWTSVCWSPELSLFVAVAVTGTGNRVMTSSDGITWITRLAVDNNWRAVCWSPELSLFVTVSDSGTGNRVMTSPDGVTWTTRTSAADNSWNGVIWSPELRLFVAVGYSGTGNRVMTSTDGITWTTRASAADNSWKGITWSVDLGLFVAVADSGTGNRVMTSPDGIVWTTRTSATDNNWASIVWSSELRLFVSVGWSGTVNRVMTSPDGITWTTRSTLDIGWVSVIWAKEIGIFVATGNNGLMTSNDGITWVSRSIAVNNNWRYIAWSPQLNLFAAVSWTGTGNRVMTSGGLGNESGEFLQLQLPRAIQPSALTILPRQDTMSATQDSPRYFLVLGVNGSNWDLLYQGSDVSWSTAAQKFPIANTKAAKYNYIRLLTTRVGNAGVSSGKSSLQIAGLTFEETITGSASTVIRPTVSSQVQQTEPGKLPRLITPTTILEFPPQSLTANTTIITNSDYANGVYTSSASDTYSGIEGDFSVYKTFDSYNLYNGGDAFWNTNPVYSTSGSYTGSTSTLAINGTSYSGEWVQLSLPQQIKVTSISILPRQDTAWTTRSPNTFVLLASNNGSDWNLIGSFTNVNNWTRSNKTFSLNTNLKFSFYRLVVSVVGNTSSAAQRLSIARWQLFGTLDTTNNYLAFSAAKNSSLSVPSKTYDIATGSGFTALAKVRLGAPDLTARPQKIFDLGTSSSSSAVNNLTMDLTTSGNLRLTSFNIPSTTDAVTSMTTWTTRASAADNSWSSICWSPELSLFVAVASSGTGNRVMTSFDGIAWVSRTSPADNSWRSVIWVPQLACFVAVSSDGTNRVMTSSDGITWVTQTSPSQGWYSVAWSPQLSLFVAVGLFGTIMTSPNGITWTTRTSPSSTSWRSIVWAPRLSKFIATGYSGSGNDTMTSSDGITWTASTAAAGTSDWWTISWSDELGIAVSLTSSGSQAMSSTDGATWTTRSTAVFAAWYGSTWCSELSLFIAVGANQVMYSINGTTWSTLTVPAQTWYSTTWSPQLGIFAVVAQSGTGNRVMTTQPIYKGINATSAANLDLVRRGMGLPSASEAVSAVSTWTTRSITSNSWFGVCWSSELAIFVAVSEYSVGGVAQVMTSSDGFTWTLRTAAAALRWRCVCWSPQIRLFVSVALNGTGNGVMTSPDGITWTTRATPADNSWNGVCWSPERSIFVAVGQGNLGVMTSNDGIVWTLQTSGTLSPNWYNVAWGKGAGIFAATTWNGITMSSPDGVTWTTRTSVGFVTGNIAWAEELSLFVCAGSGGIVTSPDGINWTTRSRINGGTTLAWAPELRLFCISSNVSSTLTSPDGITWTTRSNVGGFTMAWSPELGVFASIIASTVYRSTPVNKGPQWVTLGARYLRSDAVVALDSRQLTNTLTNNSGVYQWGEFVQQTSTARPTYISSGGYAGNPYLAFNRANSQFLERGSITLNIATNGGFTALALARFTGTVGSYERIFDFNNGIATDNIYLARFDVNQNFQLGMRNGPTNYFLRTTTSPIVQGEWAVFGCRYNGVSRIAEIFKNGVSIASTTFSAAITNRVSTINSIAKPYTADSAHFNGDLAALYTYDRALSDTELGALTQNLLSGGVPLTEMVEFSVNGRKKFVVPATAPVSSRTVAGVVGRSYTGGLYPTFSNMDLSSLYLFDRALTRSEMDSVASLLDTGSEADSSLTRTSRYTPSATRIVQVPPATSQTITGSGLTQTFTISNASYANGTFTVSSSSRQQLAREVYKMFVSSAAEWWNTGSFYNETTGFQTSNLDPTGTGYRGEWAKIELPYRFTIKRYSIKAYSSAPERCPREFALFGSTDNLTWTKIDEKINQINWGVSETRTYTITNNQSYKFYLIVINRNNNNAQALINKMFLFGVIDPAPTASSVSARYLKLRTPGQKTPITQPQIEVMDATNTNIVPTKQVAVSSLINSYTSATIGSVMPSRSYVPIQSGLIAHFDPNDPLCYSGTGATMSNLVIGTSNATFSGTYSSNNGTVRLVNFNNALISNFTISSLTNIRTVSMWFYKHTSYTNEQLLDVNVSNSQISSAGGNWIGTNWSTGTLYYNGGISQGITWTNVSQRGTGGWHNVTVISNVAITGNLTIFGQSNTWWGMDVTFGPVLVYNRVITQTENEANFNAVLTNYFTRSLTGPIATPTNLMKSTLMYPPVSLSSDTTAISSTSTSYGAGSYSILASSTSGSSAFNAFDGTSGTVWTSGTDGSFSYNTTTGSYAGTVSSTDLYGNSYTGEYLQFKLPDPVYPSSLAITPDPTNFALNAPTNFTLLGSSNDLTYTPILTTTTSWASSATKTFLINGTTGSSVPYNNYRFVSTAIGTNNTFGNVSIAELQVYGSPTASPISVQQFPPTSLTANTTMITSGSYGLGTYISSASSVASTLGSFYAFDNNINTYWHSEVTTGALYSTSGGSYIGTTTMTSGSAGYAGEWLQLQVPNPVTLDSMSLVLRQDANLWAIRSLDTFYLFGSNNGFTWDLIKSFVSINNWTPSAKFFTTNATRSYTYFRILTTVIGQAGVNGNRNCIQIAEWKLYGRESPLQEFPPAAMTAATTTFGERTFGNGSFVANASSTFGANASTNAFDKSLTTFWRTSTLSSAKVLGNAGGTSSSGIVGSAGGGGATQAGLGNSAENGGNGGEGYSTDISGTTVVYGSGGGGGRRTALATNGVGGTNGGTGGNPGTNGIDGTGSGGGGADGVSASINAFSGNGGNGIVVIRYDTTDPSSIIGSGGTTTTSGNYRIHQFNVTGGSTFTVSQVGKCDLLIVGGGGAGGRSSTFNFAGGGGGGGKVIHLNDFSLSTGSYAITVGSGGIGGDSLTPSNGGNSSFDTIIAIGGGAGGVGGGTAAQSGGSGGGGGRNATGASATAPSATLIPGTTLTNTGTTAGWTSLGNVYGPTSGSYLGSTSMTAGGVGYAGEWLQLQVPSGLVLNNYSVTPNSTLFATRSPSTFYVFGSNDGTTWTIIDTEISLTWTSSLRVFPVNLMVSYTYFRLLATVVGNSDQVSGRDTVNITEWRLYGQEVQTDPYTIIDLGTDVPIKQIRYFNDVSSTTASTNVLGGELTLFNAAGTQVYSKALDSQQEVYNLLDTTYTDAYSMTKTPFSASFQSHNESAIGFDSKYTGTYTNESDSVPFGIRKTRDTLALQVGSQSTSGTLVTWSNAITIYNSGGISFGSGTVLARVFEGTALAGTGNANVNSFTVTLPQPLTSSSYVTYVTPEVSSGTDVFFCTVTNKTVSSFVVNVVRSDAQSWSSTLSINWELFM